MSLEIKKPDANPTPTEPPAKVASGQRLLDRLNQGATPPADDPPAEPDVTPDEPDNSPDPSPSLTPPSSDGDNGSGEPFGEGLDLEPPPSNPWLDSVRELGFQDIENEDQARERMLEAYRQKEAREQQILQRYQQIAPLVQYGQQYLAIQKDPRFQQVFQPQAQPEQPKSWWNPPDYDPVVAAQYQVKVLDPVTQEEVVQWSPKTPESVKAAHNAYQDYLADWHHKLLYKPQEALGEAIRQEAERLYEERVKKDREQTTQVGALERFQQENADILFDRDPITNQLTTRLSAHGRMIQHFIDEAEESGATNPEFIFRYAMTRYREEMAGHQQAPPSRVNGQNGSHTGGQPTPQKTVPERHMDHLKRGAGLKRGPGGIPNRGGSLPVNDNSANVPPNPNLTSGQRFLERLKVDGLV